MKPFLDPYAFPVLRGNHCVEQTEAFMQVQDAKGISQQVRCAIEFTATARSGEEYVVSLLYDEVTGEVEDVDYTDRPLTPDALEATAIGLLAAADWLRAELAAVPPEEPPVPKCEGQMLLGATEEVTS